jgi:hypothetical protein
MSRHQTPPNARQKSLSPLASATPTKYGAKCQGIATEPGQLRDP